MALRDPQLARWLLGSLSSGLVAVDAEGVLVALNGAAQRILGAPDGPPERCLGRDFREVLGGRPALAALLADALEGRERPSRAELRLEAGGDRRPHTIGFTVLPIRDDAGRLRGAAIQFRDLDAFEQLDEQERLRDRLAALGEMAAGLAHELRNPLAGMEMMAGLLARRLAGREEEQELVRELLAQLRTMAHTLNQVLEFARPASFAPRPLDPVSLLEECLERACARVPFPGKVERRYAEPLPAVVADPEEVRHALTDVLVNALEAMADGEDGRAPRLELALSCERRSRPLAPERGGELVIVVSDNGPGVPAELRDRIFYPFFSTKHDGSGVGLAHAQKVFTSHGGSIELECPAAGGARFRLRLPLPGEPT